ncbi:hypothetical protein LTR36_009961 [Oleoguttula mirabilis]|uniref:Uncharacterized protein n=1 Tax=Oleoguttula mirabilis TaxID=1507867 RepID=A0AAV9J5I6_9PEZI|nr:hypothetical protein LTR36_009961 [Oleoguttula mirabilis]
MTSPQRKGVATPQLRALVRSATNLEASNDDDATTINSALANALFPLAEMRDMAYEALTTLKKVHADLAAMVDQMEARGLERPSLGYPMGTDLFLTNKPEILKFELRKAKSFFANILGEIREVKEDEMKMRMALQRSARDEVCAAAQRQAETSHD